MNAPSPTIRPNPRAVGGPPKRRGIAWRTLLVALVGICGVGGAWCYWLWKSEPVYWQEREEYFATTSPAERLAIAESVERRILAVLNNASATNTSSAAHSGGHPAASPVAAGRRGTAGGGSASGAGAGDDSNTPQAIDLSTKEINAWIDTRLEHWLSNQDMEIPEGMSEPMMAIEGENLIIAFRVDRPPVNQIVSVACDIDLGDDLASVQVVSVRGGRLRIPGAKTAAARYTKAKEPESEDLTTKVVEFFEGWEFEPVITISNQPVRIVSIKLHKKGARLVVRAEPE